MVVRRGRGLTSIGAAVVACVLTLAFGGFVLAAAAPTTTVTTTNEFGTRGYTTNGDVILTSPLPTATTWAGTSAGAALTNRPSRWATSSRATSSTKRARARGR